MSIGERACVCGAFDHGAHSVSVGLVCDGLGAGWCRLARWSGQCEPQCLCDGSAWLVVAAVVFHRRRVYLSDNNLSGTLAPDLLQGLAELRWVQGRGLVSVVQLIMVCTCVVFWQGDRNVQQLVYW